MDQVIKFSTIAKGAESGGGQTLSEATTRGGILVLFSQVSPVEKVIVYYKNKAISGSK